MAKGTAQDQFVVVSKVRTGLKRELQFALKSQSEICGGSLGRTRASKAPNGDSGDAPYRRTRNSQLNNKRLTAAPGMSIVRKKRRVGKVKETNDSDESVGACNPEEEEAKSDVVDHDDVNEDLTESVSRKLFNGDAVMEIVDEDSGFVESGECMRKIDGRKQESEPEGAAYDKREGEKGMTVVMETDLGKDRDNHVQISETKSSLKGLVVDEKAKRRQSKKLLNGSTKVEIGLVDKPLKRFTRSSLNANGGINTPDARVDGSDSPVSLSKELENRLGEGLEKAGEEELLNNKVMDVDNGVIKSVQDFNGSPKPAPLPSVGVNGSVDKPLPMFTQLSSKQEAVLDKSDAQPTNLGLVVNESEGVEIKDLSSMPNILPLTPGRPLKYARCSPQKLKDLLRSGILEGLTVYYVKSRGVGTTGLKGVIKGSGILCFCHDCKGAQVVTPAMYELHASSTNRRPPEYILLENGKTLRDVMNACRETPLEKLEEHLPIVVGLSMKRSHFCFHCKEPITEPGGIRALVLCSSCKELKEPLRVSRSSTAETPIAVESRVSCVELEGPKKVAQDSSARACDAIDRSPEPGVTPKIIHREPKGSALKSTTQGRITRKDNRLHKLVFEEDVLPDGSEVAYFVRGKKMLVGYKKGFGIHCSCCNTVISPSQFEAHAGWAPRRKPFQHIYTSNGVSLHELSVALLKDRKFSTIENDDLCSICGDGGDLLCCDTCPRSFHSVCACIPSVPTGSWSCKYCQSMLVREKFVERNANAIAAGRVAGVDAIAEITKRCIRIVSSLANVLPSVCVLCRGHSFSRLGFGPRTVIICDQCEKEFHVGCLRDQKIVDLKVLPEGQWFCGADCNKIFTELQKLVAHGEEMLPTSHLDYVKKKQDPCKENSSDNSAEPDIRWSVLSGKLVSSDDTKVLLSRAVSIFHERFDPISETGTRGDLIPAMVYGRQFKGQDFSGMYCALLTVNQVIVSVGIFRILGSELAELPLVATCSEYQGQGYFQCLFYCIERLLGSLGVRNLVLPAADEAKSIWTNKFGFSKMTEEEVEEYRKDFSFMVFDGTSMLLKPVSPGQVTDTPAENTE